MKHNSLKNKDFLIFFILAGCYFSVGCAPIYDNEYNFTAPTTPKGETCIRQCETSKHQCFDLEKKKNAYCSLQVELACDEKTDWLENKNRRCESHYRRCYQACGGRIKNQKACISGCN